MPRRITIWHALGLGLIARLAGLAAFGGIRFPDSEAYIKMGRQLLEDGSSGVSHFMPLYPIWTYVTGGAWFNKLADIGLSLALIWLIYRLTEILFGDRRAALIAAVIAALYPHFIFYAAVQLTEIPFAFLVCGGFLLLYKERYAAGAVVLVLSILIRPTIEPLLPLLIAAFAMLIHRRSWRLAARKVLLLAIVYVTLMAPWWVHNYARYDTFVRLNLGDGRVLYAGNNDRIEAGGRIYQDEIDYGALGLTGLSPFERNRQLREMAIQFIAENPQRFVELMAVRFVRFWRLWPYTDEFKSPVIVLSSLLSYGVVLALTLICLFRRLRTDWRRLSPILLFSGFVMTVHIVTIASIRFRFPIEPFLIVLAASVLAEWSRRFVWIDPWFGEEPSRD